MKKVLLTVATVGLAVSVFAQGTVIFNTAITGTLRVPVYGANPANLGQSLVGNPSTATPAGTQVYAGPLLSGATYSAQIFAAPGAGAADSALAGATPIGAFRTGTAAGYVSAGTATLGNVLPDAAVATLQLRVWDNKSGQYPDWAAASAAWQKGLIAAGMSPKFDLALIGGQVNQAPALAGLQSFNIYFVPEPSTMALAGLGAAAMLIFRRRK